MMRQFCSHLGSNWLVVGLGLALLLTACGRRPAAEVEPTATPTVEAIAEVSQTATPTPLPTATPIPPGPPEGGESKIPPAGGLGGPPTATPTPLHPLMIEVMRQQAYPGSEITVEETLEPGPNYDRYIVSYLSEGNKIFALLTVPRGEKPASGWPVIVFNHGFIPPAQYRTTERYVAYVDET